METNWKFRDEIPYRRFDSRVELTTNYYSEEPIWIEIEGRGENYSDSICLTPARARDLAAWLVKTADEIEAIEKT